MHTHFLKTVFILFLFGSLCTASTCDGDLGLEDLVCEGSDCFSIPNFAENLESRLDATTLGYSYAIYYDQTLQAWGANGQARRSQDGNPYDVDALSTNMNVGSCAKSITGIATLQVLEDNSIPLTAKIVDYLPTWWTVGGNVAQITFQDLLRHESGFRPTTDAVTYEGIKANIAAGIDVNDYGDYEYQNMNFCLMRILVPILDGTFDRTVVMADGDADDETTDQFVAYLQDNIFTPLNLQFDCENADAVAYYSLNNPGQNGWPLGYECDKAGGGTLSMSANDLAKVMHFAKYSDVVLSSTARAMLFNESFPLACYSNNVNGAENWGDHFHHNGLIRDTDNMQIARGATACWYSFHNDITVAVSTNSLGGIWGFNGYANINDLIEQAFDDSFVIE